MSLSGLHVKNFIVQKSLLKIFLIYSTFLHCLSDMDLNLFSSLDEAGGTFSVSPQSSSDETPAIMLKFSFNFESLSVMLYNNDTSKVSIAVLLFITVQDLQWGK